MDPLTAFSVAGTIIQFVDYGTKLLLGANELELQNSFRYFSSERATRTHHIRPTVCASKAGHFSTTSAGKGKLLSKDEGKLEISFRKICDEAAAVAKEPMENLKKLKVDDSAKSHRRVWASLSKAIESAWTRREREELTKKLNNLKEALETRVLFSFRANFDLFTVQVSERFDSLDKQTQTIVSALVEDRKFAANHFSHTGLEQTSTLAHLLNRLQHSNTEEHRKTRAMIANIGNRDIISSIEVLDVSYDEEAWLRKLVNDEILVGLYFQSMAERYEEVPDAYQNTFHWIFDAPTDQQAPWANFLDWLCHRGGIYWIKGKAGSGKSTLMKSVYDDPRLRQNLDTWAPGRQLHIASFFFWNSGMQYQKSQQGLIRAISFQVLKEEPDLIPIVLPLQWARKYSSLVSGSKSDLVNEPWKLRSLKDGFNLLVKQTLLPIKLCLFIDGLDEFDGDHNEMAEIFKSVTSPYVKVCVSSRLWIVFEESFEGCPGLRLQDLTKEDIKQCVGGTFANSASFRRLLCSRL